MVVSIVGKPVHVLKKKAGVLQCGDASRSVLEHNRIITQYCLSITTASLLNTAFPSQPHHYSILPFQGMKAVPDEVRHKCGLPRPREERVFVAQVFIHAWTSIRASGWKESMFSPLCTGALYGLGLFCNFLA